MVGEGEQGRTGTEGRAEEAGQVFGGGWTCSRSRPTLVSLGSLMCLVHKSSISYCFHSGSVSCVQTPVLFQHWLTDTAFLYLHCLLQVCDSLLLYIVLMALLEKLDFLSSEEKLPGGNPVSPLQRQAELGQGPGLVLGLHTLACPVIMYWFGLFCWKDFRLGEYSAGAALPLSSWPKLFSVQLWYVLFGFELVLTQGQKLWYVRAAVLVV